MILKESSPKPLSFRLQPRQIACAERDGQKPCSALETRMAAMNGVTETAGWAETAISRKSGELEGEEQVSRLLERVAVGDREALGKLYDATARVVYGLAIRITGCQRAATKVTEAVYADLWAQGAAVADQADLLVWLAERTRAEAMNYRRRVWPQLLLWWRLTPTANQAGPEGARPLEVGSWESKRHRATSALKDLADSERTVLELAYFGGLKVAEISTRLGLGESVVKELLRRGVRNFRLLGHRVHHPRPKQVQ